MALPRPFHSRQGATLLETVIVVALIAVLSLTVLLVWRATLTATRAATGPALLQRVVQGQTQGFPPHTYVQSLGPSTQQPVPGSVKVGSWTLVAGTALRTPGLLSSVNLAPSSTTQQVVAMAIPNPTARPGTAYILTQNGRISPVTWTPPTGTSSPKGAASSSPQRAAKPGPRPAWFDHVSWPLVAACLLRGSFAWALVMALLLLIAPELSASHRRKRGARWMKRFRGPRIIASIPPGVRSLTFGLIGSSIVLALT